MDCDELYDWIAKARHEITGRDDDFRRNSRGLDYDDFDYLTHVDRYESAQAFLQIALQEYLERCYDDENLTRYYSAAFKSPEALGHPGEKPSLLSWMKNSLLDRLREAARFVTPKPRGGTGPGPRPPIRPVPILVPREDALVHESAHDAVFEAIDNAGVSVMDRATYIWHQWAITVLLVANDRHGGVVGRPAGAEQRRMGPTRTFSRNS